MAAAHSLRLASANTHSVALPQAKHVQVELQPELDTFAAWERMSTEFSQLLRASFKEFHLSCRYYKGQGRPYMVWLRETYPESFVIHLERADGGRQVRIHMQQRTYFLYLKGKWSRTRLVIHCCVSDEQDLDYDAAVPLYIDRKYLVEFLHDRVFQQKHSNILEDFLYVTFSSLQYVAMARANGLVDVLISRPLRWLSGMLHRIALLKLCVASHFH